MMRPHKLLPAIGAVSTSLLLAAILFTAVFGGRVEQAPYFTLDRLTMTTTCAGEAPIYAAPDGRFWAWRGTWRQVEFSWGGDCQAGSTAQAHEGVAVGQNDTSGAGQLDPA